MYYTYHIIILCLVSHKYSYQNITSFGDVPETFSNFDVLIIGFFKYLFSQLSSKMN